jgi:hypothetical protein
LIITQQASPMVISRWSAHSFARPCPQVLAALRNAAMSVLRREGVTNVAAAVRRNAARVGELLVKLHL